MPIQTADSGLLHALHSTTMDERRWRSAQQGYMDEPLDAVPDEQVRVSSKGRPWHGMALWHQMAGVDDLYIPAAGKHCIIMRKGATTGLVQCHGLATQVRRWNTGEIVLLPANTPSFWRTELPRDNIHLDLSPQWLDRVNGGSSGHLALRSCFGSRDLLLQQMINMLMTSLSDNTSLHPTFADGIATSVAVHLLEHYRATGTADKSPPLSTRQLRRVAEIVHASLRQPITVPLLAAELDMSVFHFSRCFKLATGQTPHQHVLACRLEHARALLLESRLAVTDIAQATGFSSPSHFSKAFRQHWGSTPSAFRRRT